MVSEKMPCASSYIDKALSASRQRLNAPAQSVWLKRTLLGALDLLGDPYLETV